MATPNRSHVRRRAFTHALICGACCTLVVSTMVSAQHVRPIAVPLRGVSAATRSQHTPAVGSGVMAHSGVRADTIAPWWAPAASGLVPGAGQFMLRQQRSVAYLAIEAFLVIQYLGARREANDERDRYRLLAADIARAPFGGARPTGKWEYYEAMEKYLESGRYDITPGGALDPETDTATYNGARWRLARETYWFNPDSAPARSSAAYQSALGAYQEKAARDEYRWSWRDAQLEQDIFVQTIAGANRSKQRATTLLNIVALNHLVSLVDSYISVRVRRYGGVRVAGLTLTGAQTVVAPGLTASSDRVELRLRALIPGQRATLR